MDGLVGNVVGRSLGERRLLLHGLDSLYVSFYFDVANSALDLDDLPVLERAGTAGATR